MREAMTLREAMDRLFADAFVQPFGGADGEGVERAMPMPVDVIENEDDIVVKASIPGIKAEDIDISLTGDVLIIRGATKAENEVKRGNYIYRERRQGAFGRTLTLPTAVVADQARAEFENGELTLTLPKADEVKPKTIAIKQKK
jgi:HSP20 family protein